MDCQCIYFRVRICKWLTSVFIMSGVFLGIFTWYIKLKALKYLIYKIIWKRILPWIWGFLQEAVHRVCHWRHCTPSRLSTARYVLPVFPEMSPLPGRTTRQDSMPKQTEVWKSTSGLLKCKTYYNFWIVYLYI